MKIQIDKVVKATTDILMAAGVPEEHAKIVADTVRYAHSRGKHTHGIGRVPIYVRKIEDGLMDAETPIETLNDFAAILRIDAHNGFGQVATYYAMEEAAKRAETYGISYVSIKDSNNFGTAGYFAKMAADKNMIGIVMGNSAPAIAPSGGREAMFGTNPISIAFPLIDSSNPFIFDMATSVAARGKIRLAAKNGESIPIGWALDKDGNPTTNPNAAIEGTMIPIGEYKGVGISMVIDVLAGLLSGSAFAGDVKALNEKKDFSRYGHGICVIDFSKFMSVEDYEERISYFVNRVKQYDGIMPGEKSYEYEIQSGGETNIPDKQIEDLRILASKYNIFIEL